MATPNEKLAASLAQFRKLQGRGQRVLRSGELTRVHRERLVRNGFLREVMKGWLISWSPDADPGDTTPWSASFREFCAAYCTARFGPDWHLSPEQSLLLHAENTVMPQQVIVYAPRGTNNAVELLFGTSLYDLRQRDMPPDADLTDRDGLRLFVPEAALVRVPAAFFVRHPVEAQVVLSGVREAADLLGRLLDGGRSVVAGRLAGAFRRIGRGEVADEILGVMKRAGYDVREADPFEPKRAFGALSRAQAPIVGRLQSLWEAMREPVIAAFPEAPGLPDDPEAYMSFVDVIYRNDAYHSLSIEGYRVTPELIDRVRGGNWDPDNCDADRQGRDALAARGYWQAFRLVRAAVGEIVGGGEAGALVRKAHRNWYRELFQPCVAAGLIAASALAGYRNDAVFRRGSRHVPPRREAVRDAMPALFDLLEAESEPSVRAVLGHWLFGYVHPYPDGNGRMARLVMNAMLASGGYPWTVIRVGDRDAYLAALESASIDQDIRPFAQFVADRVAWSPGRAEMASYSAEFRDRDR
ncbi:MAG: Fic family protein [Rhodospirillaceae bacterium]|nr:Fic family protein [Rhodospirillaceae bacterium]MDE0256350.1 Fic family protein [Rhodospirillaceae bacterium]MDE0617612.1 Fic family protein [Rhodospirillaceae bacterium]